MIGYKKVRVVQTIAQAVPSSGRPRCGNCGKLLRVETSVRYLGNSLDNPVQGTPLSEPWCKEKPLPWDKLLGIYSTSERQVVVSTDFAREHIKKIESIGEEVFTYYAHVTTGKFVGFSGRYSVDPPFFCTQACAAAFGCSVYASGQRRKGIND